MNRTVILYHGDCPDGFGAAYAAWKKFGDSAEYIPLGRSDVPPAELCAGANVFMLDFTYGTKEEMREIEAVAASFTVLDHHEGVREVTESVKNHVYDVNRSGAGITWDHLHPNTPRPKLIEFIEDDDLFRFRLSDTRPMLSYLGLHPFTFEFWDETSTILEDPARSEELLKKARIFGECFEKLAELSVAKAKLVEFEGHVVSFANAHPYKPIKSLVGNLLARKYPPFALVVSAHPKGYGISARGDGSIDLTKIAQKYGGNGHPSSSGFHVPADQPLPWTLIEKDEDSRD